MLSNKEKKPQPASLRVDERLAVKLRDAYHFVDRGEWTDAWMLCNDILNESPDHPMGLYLTGCCLREQKCLGLALQLFRRALAFEKSVPNIWMHYGACLHDTHQYEQAREAFMVVHNRDKTDPMPIGNIAAAYTQEGKAALAIEWADRALAIDPVHRIAHVARAMGCLALGRWTEGWASYPYVYGEQISIRIYGPPGTEQPEWDGTPGQTVVVQCEQGVGDIIMNAQCLLDAVKVCKELIVDCNPRMAPLIARTVPGAIVYGTMKQAKVDWPLKYKIDARIHISRLPQLYRNKDSDFPRKAYLVPHEEIRKRWRAYLEQFPRPWVGLTWQGGISFSNAEARSIELAEWAPVLKQPGTFISLSHLEVGLEVARWNLANPGKQVQKPFINNEHIDDLAALVAELDHVVSVTTTAAHIAGALGKRAYVLVPNVPAWRYGYGGDGMLWYPENSVRLYRQKGGERGFGHAINRLAADYEAFVAPIARAA